MPSSRVGAMRPVSCRRHDLAPVGPPIQHRLHLRRVPGHHDVGQQAQRIGDGLHLVGTPGLRRRDAAGVDRALERVDRLAAVEDPSQLAPESWR